MDESMSDPLLKALRSSRPAPDPAGDAAMTQRIVEQLAALGTKDADRGGLVVGERSPRRRLAVAGVAASVAVAGLAAGVLLATGAGPVRPSRDVGARLTVQLLAGHVRSALADASSSSLEATSMKLTSSSGAMVGSLDGWFYGDQTRVELFDAGGSPAMDVGTTHGSGTRTTTVVNYTTQQWSTLTRTLPGEQSLFDVASVIRAGLADGSISVAGTAPLNGSPAEEIDVQSSLLEPNQVVALPDKMLNFPFVLERPADAAAGVADVELWIDPSSDLPMQETVTFPDGSQSTTTFQWEPPTAANLAQLTVTPPTSFTEVASGIDFAAAPDAGQVARSSTPGT